MKKTIGERIRERREELHMSADALGEAIGKSRATIYRYENGFIMNVPADVLAKIAKALKTTPADLMGFSPDEPEQKEEYYTPLEKEIIRRFRALNDGERSMFLRSLGLDDFEAGTADKLA